MPPTAGTFNANVKEEPSNANMNSMERYRHEWHQLLSSLDTNPDCIRDIAFDGRLQISKFRSVYWSLLLRVLSEDHRTWSLQRHQQRERYDKLRQEFIKNPHQLNSNQLQDDPLSQSSKSIWNQYFSDQELFVVIRQDVVRTFPGVDFFRKPVIQNVMSNILFHYAREHPYMCYRQGMHEILAPVLFVMYGDHQSFLHFKEIVQNLKIDETLMEVLNPLYLEADSYFIFSRIMASIESYYRVSSGIVSNNIDAEKSFESSDMENSSTCNPEIEVVGQLNLIRDTILAKEDLHLHNYLMKLDIPLHIFGIRWLRLLFGREFALLDLLLLWDAIFADSDRFDLPNYIVVAMLIRIRDKLLLSDYTTCLTYLMRYPANVDITLVLRHALHMQMPKKYDRPSNAFVYFTIPPTVKTSPDIPSGSTKDRKRNSTSSIDNGRTRSTSLEESAALMERQIQMMQTRNAADEALLARLQSASEQNRLAMDGYKDNNLELVRLELRNVQTAVTVARSKLQSYLQTIRQHMPKQSSTEVTDALDGIEDLCQFLDVKFGFPLHSRSDPIDQALEADEQQQRQKKETTETITHNLKNDINSTTTSSDSFVSSRASTDHVLIYERPDNGFMLQSSRLGNIKEFELIPITSNEKTADPLKSITAAYTGNRSGGGGLPAADPLSLKSHSNC